MRRWLSHLFGQVDEADLAHDQRQRSRERRDVIQQRHLEEATRKSEEALRKISEVEQRFEAQVRLRGRKFK